MISKSRLKNILELRCKKNRDEQKLFLIEGYRLCQEALQSDFAVETLLLNPNFLSPQKLNEIVQLARNNTNTDNQNDGDGELENHEHSTERKSLFPRIKIPLQDLDRLKGREKNSRINPGNKPDEDRDEK